MSRSDITTTWGALNGIEMSRRKAQMIVEGFANEE